MSVLPQVVTRNWRLKLAALALSLFLWAVVTAQPRNRQVLTSVPVQVVVNDPGWTLAEPPSPAAVSVQLAGTTRELLQLSRGLEAGVVRVPVDQVAGPDTIVRLRNDWVILYDGPGIVVENLAPATVALRLEPARSTVLPLSLRTVGELPSGLALAQALGLTPPVVRVRGPARVVERLDSIPLAPLDLSTVTESRLYRVRVDTSGLGNVDVEPPLAEVAVRLEASAERVIAGVPVLVEAPAGTDPSMLVPQPSTIQVTLRGARTLVAQASTDALAAVVSAQDLEGLPAGSEREVPLRVRGVPNLVRAFSAVDSVRVQHLPEVPAPRPDTLPSDTIPTAPRPGTDTAAARGGGAR